MGTPLPIEAATISMANSLILMVIALVVFGPRKLPQLGRQVGKLMYEFRKASNDFKFQMEEELRSAEEADRRKREEAERNATPALTPPTAGETTATGPTAIEPVTDAAAAVDTASDPAADPNNPYVGYADYVQKQEAEAATSSGTSGALAATAPAAASDPASTAALEVPAAAEAGPAPIPVTESTEHHG